MNDVIIIGAGPAGLAAAIACRKWDLSTLVIDEYPVPGGRLLGQLYEQPDGSWWNGIEETNKLHTEAKELDTQIKCGVSVYHVEKREDEYEVHTDEGVFYAKNVLIATGAAEVKRLFLVGHYQVLCRLVPHK